MSRRSKQAMRDFAARATLFLTATMLAVGLTLGISVVLAAPAGAQSLNLDLGGGDDGASTGRIIQLLSLLTVLSLAPAIVMIVTSFTRIVVVLSFLRSTLGMQQVPPNMVIVSLVLFLTGFVMALTFERAYADSIAPLMAEQTTEEEAFPRIIAPARAFDLPPSCSPRYASKTSNCSSTWRKRLCRKARKRRRWPHLYPPS